ncbi:MAG: hypothetical protein V4472_02615 [Pseudomonadota bacterium]
MPLQLFLNDLSAPSSVVTRSRSINYLKGLVATVRAARTIDGGLILNCEQPLNSLALGHGVTIASIRNDGECVEESQYLKTLNDRAPFGRVFADVGEQDLGRCEYKIPDSAAVAGGEAASALGLAHMLRGLAVSIPSAVLWSLRDIKLELYEIDDGGEIRKSIVSARNASIAADVGAHENDIRQDLRPSFRNGRDMWSVRDVLFPNLVFIPRTKSQIEGILAGDPLLDQVWIKLSGINNAMAVWRATGSAHPMFPFNVRPESQSRMGYVQFKDAAGVVRAFSDHADLAPIEGRVHFIVAPEPHRHALIGHVGRKLGIG